MKTLVEMINRITLRQSYWQVPQTPKVNEEKFQHGR